MRRRGEAERLRLRILIGMQARLDFAKTDDHDGQDKAKEHCAHADHTGEADRFEHDIAKISDLVRLNDFHYDRCARRLHGTSVQQGC